MANGAENVTKKRDAVEWAFIGLVLVVAALLIMYVLRIYINCPWVICVISGILSPALIAPSVNAGLRWQMYSKSDKASYYKSVLPSIPVTLFFLIKYRDLMSSLIAAITILGLDLLSFLIGMGFDMWRRRSLADT